MKASPQESENGNLHHENGGNNMSEPIIAYKGFDKEKTWYKCVDGKFVEV